MKDSGKVSRLASYPVPGPVGGRLIRQVIGLFRDQKVKLPLDSHILIGVSGGVDSMALAHLLIRFGRRVVDASQIRLVHINHGWRGRKSDADATFVAKQAAKWDVPLEMVKLGAHLKKGQSSEDLARRERKRRFEQLADQYQAIVLTAHHADDLFETLLWRLFTGTSGSQGGGILFQDGIYLRPLLDIYKKDLKAFLKEEKLSWREDHTNDDVRFLRAKMRKQLIPSLLKIFPRAAERLNQQALRIQGEEHALLPGEHEAIAGLFGMSGVRPRRAHWEAILNKSPDWIGSISLPEGWVLRAERAPSGRRWSIEPRPEH